MHTNLREEDQFTPKNTSAYQKNLCDNVYCVSNVSFTLIISIEKFNSTSFNLKQEVFIRRDEEKT